MMVRMVRSLAVSIFGNVVGLRSRPIGSCINLMLNLVHMLFESYLDRKPIFILRSGRNVLNKVVR
jgi:hypothetical protein